MKKVLLFLCLFSMLSVNAKENRLYFSEVDKKLYYDSDLLDKNIFMNHVEMIPGSSYKDELTIENGANKEYTLYFKVEVKEQSKNAMELMEYTTMKLYYNDELIYDGNIKGIDYYNDGNSLEEAIKIGNIKAKGKSILRAETRLREDYDNINNKDYSYVDWNFYAEYDDSIEVIVPKTDLNEGITLKIIAGLVFIGAIVTFVIYKNKKQSIES